MNKTWKQRLEDDINFEIEQRKQLLDKLQSIPVGYIAEAFPQGDWSQSWGFRFEFCLPFVFGLIDEVKQFMADQLPEWHLCDERRHVWDDSNAAGHFLEYTISEKYWTNDAINFQVAFRTSKEGTTCVLHEIGTKEVPVYEVICQEGAMEEL
jgi:hypothetical protein